MKEQKKKLSTQMSFLRHATYHTSHTPDPLGRQGSKSHVGRSPALVGVVLLMVGGTEAGDKIKGVQKVPVIVRILEFNLGSRVSGFAGVAKLVPTYAGADIYLI